MALCSDLSSVFERLRMDSMCRFDGRVVTALAASSSEVRCAAPPYAPPAGASTARVEVALTFSGGSGLWSEGAPPLVFTYYAMRISGVAPLGGPTAGGTRITIRGQGFELGGNVSAVRAKASCAGGEVLELGSASAVTLQGATFRMQPTASAGPSALQVALNALEHYDGDYVGGEPEDVHFRFYRPPLVSALSPAVGPVRGNTMLTLRGAGFDAFGEVPHSPTIRITAANTPGIVVWNDLAPL